MGSAQLRWALFLGMPLLAAYSHAAGIVGSASATVVKPVAVSADNPQLRFAYGERSASGKGRVEVNGTEVIYAVELSGSTEIVTAGGATTTAKLIGLAANAIASGALLTGQQTVTLSANLGAGARLPAGNHSASIALMIAYN